MKSHRPAIFFDLDGTLTDPVEGITKSIAHALGKLGVASPPLEKLHWCIGPPLHKSFEKMLGCEKKAKLAVHHYRERYAAEGMFENKAYEGIMEALSALKNSGFELFVATSKYNVIAEKVIEHFGFHSFFRKIYGSEHDGTRADKSELISFILSQEGLKSSRCFMVGDREHDMIGARNNGLRRVGVAWGYGTRHELESSGAGVILNCPRELQPYFEDISPE